MLCGAFFLHVCVGALRVLCELTSFETQRMNTGSKQGNIILPSLHSFLLRLYILSVNFQSVRMVKAGMFKTGTNVSVCQNLPRSVAHT